MFIFANITYNTESTWLLLSLSSITDIISSSFAD